jgi:Raf kinase inhibitor-like YbhB/YbcL family protein
MHLTSPAFKNGEKIGKIYTCEGEGISPPLFIEEVPKAAKSLVLIMDDPDVPAYIRKDQMFDHWVIFNMDPHTKELKAGMKPPGIEGKNSSGQNGYIGPCPPDREHRYFFKLYALDTLLKLSNDVSKKDVEEAMQGHILAEAVLMGRYEKKSH